MQGPFVGCGDSRSLRWYGIPASNNAPSSSAEENMPSSFNGATIVIADSAVRSLRAASRRSLATLEYAGKSSRDMTSELWLNPRFKDLTTEQRELLDHQSELITLVSPLCIKLAFALVIICKSANFTLRQLKLASIV